MLGNIISSIRRQLDDTGAQPRHTHRDFDESMSESYETALKAAGLSSQ